MDKNIIKNYLKSFVSEAVSPTPATTPAIKLAKKIGKENEKENKAGLKAIAKDMESYEKPLTTADPNQKEMAPNKYDYNGNTEKDYHDQMEIMNGQEMIQYDRKPTSRFAERAIEAIEGSSNMGNNPEWANVYPKQQGFTGPEFGKNLVKKVKASEKKRSQQTPTSKMFGDDWEVVEDKSHKSYAFESVEDKTKCPVCDKSKSECKCTDKEKGAHAMKGLDADYEKDSRATKYGTNPELDENKNKNKTQIKESMKRLRFKNEFNGVGNALKLIPESYKVDEKVFEMTDGNESYRIRWEGSINEGKAVVLMASDSKLVNEDMQKMKRLMGYKSQETIGTLKGQERINENTKFNDIWNKTKQLMNEVEDNDGDAEEGNLDDAITSQAPEAKKHVHGTTSSDKGVSAVAKLGNFEDAAKPQAPEAKKHVHGSASSDKGTTATAKTGQLDKAITSQAKEAKAHMSEDVKKKVNEVTDEDEIDSLSDRLDDIRSGEEELDEPIVKRKDAYDASLDIEDPEDVEKTLSKSDIEKPTQPVKFVGADIEDDEDEIEVPEIVPGATYKLMRNSKGEHAIIMVRGNDKQFVTIVPEKYIDIAKKDAMAALEAMRDESEMSDDELMETLDEMLGETETE